MPYVVKLSFKNEIKTFSGKQNLREFLTTKTCLMRNVKGISSRCNAMMINCNTKSYETIKLTNKDNYINKPRVQ